MIAAAFLGLCLLLGAAAGFAQGRDRARHRRSCSCCRYRDR